MRRLLVFIGLVLVMPMMLVIYIFNYLLGAARGNLKLTINNKTILDIDLNDEEIKENDF